MSPCSRDSTLGTSSGAMPLPATIRPGFPRKILELPDPFATSFAHSSSEKPFSINRSASRVFFISTGVGLTKCGSWSPFASEVISTRSPPISCVSALMIGNVHTTLSFFCSAACNGSTHSKRRNTNVSFRKRIDISLFIHPEWFGGMRSKYKVQFEKYGIATVFFHQVAPAVLIVHAEPQEFAEVVRNVRRDALPHEIGRREHIGGIVTEAGIDAAIELPLREEVVSFRSSTVRFFDRCFGGSFRHKHVFAAQQERSPLAVAQWLPAIQEIGTVSQRCSDAIVGWMPVAGPAELEAVGIAEIAEPAQMSEIRRTGFALR